MRAALFVFTACEPKSRAEGVTTSPPTGGGNFGAGSVPAHNGELIQVSLPPLLMTLNWPAPRQFQMPARPMLLATTFWKLADPFRTCSCST